MAPVSDHQAWEEHWDATGGPRLRLRPHRLAVRRRIISPAVRRYHRDAPDLE